MQTSIASDSYHYQLQDVVTQARAKETVSRQTKHSAKRDNPPPLEVSLCLPIRPYQNSKGNVTKSSGGISETLQPSGFFYHSIQEATMRSAPTYSNPVFGPLAIMALSLKRKGSGLSPLAISDEAQRL